MLNRIINMSPQGSLGSGMISILAARQNGNLLANWQNAYRMKSLKGRSMPQPGKEELRTADSSDMESTFTEDGSLREEEAAEEKIRPAVQGGEEKLSAAGAVRPASFSRQELQKAIAMSVILGPPACRKRKRYEGNTGRR